MRLWRALFVIGVFVFGAVGWTTGRDEASAEEKGRLRDALITTWVWDQGQHGVATLTITKIADTNEITAGVYTYESRGKTWTYPFQNVQTDGNPRAEGKVNLENGQVRITLHPGGSSYDLTYQKLFRGDMLQGTFNFVQRQRVLTAQFVRRK